MSSAAAPRVGVSTGIEDVDAATLSEVFSRLDPASILSASASSKHLASAADEPLWRDVFAKSWDEPVWEVSSYRHLHLVRHRALLLLRSLPDAPPPDDDPDAWLAVADACDVVASAVNASLRVERTDATIDDANITPTLARLLRSSTRVAAPRVARVSPRDAAFLAACRAYGACVSEAADFARDSSPKTLPPKLARCFARRASPTIPSGVASRSRRIRLRIVASRRGRWRIRAETRRRRRAFAAALGGAAAAAPAWPPATPHRPRMNSHSRS